MANTTNFGWETPDDTDLVKDGAAAMRTLGNSIDASFVDLKGGTTGQILSKNSNTDLDYTWINNDQGDITGVTAGTGISGGGTSGTVTITNSMATEITAAGDIIVGTGSGTFDNLPIGTTGEVLTADTTVSPYKVKWAAVSTPAPSVVGCRAYHTVDQSIATATWTIVSFNSESWDTDGFHSTSSNTSRFTIPSGKAGKYLFLFVSAWDSNTTGNRSMGLYKNGSFYYYGSVYSPYYSTTSTPQSSYQWTVDAAVGDYFEFANRQTSGGNLTLFSGESSMTATIMYLGA